VPRDSRFVRSGLIGLALGVGLCGSGGGCGGTSGPESGAEGEKVPEGFVKMKDAIKGQAAAKKGGQGVPKGAARR
jgi:hypothetical protein